MNRTFGMKRLAWLGVALLAVFIGCEGKRIENLGSIDGTTSFNARGVTVRINLLTETGDFMLWSSDTFGGAGVLPEEDLDSRVQVWSIKDGHRHKIVYSGRLRTLQWNAQLVNSFRAVLGLVPANFIEFDTEADTPLGEIDVTFITPNQGEFETTIFNAQIYPAMFFDSGSSGEEF